MSADLVKVVSGGQTGVDQARLRAARRLGIETGGWAPTGWRTIAGPAPWLADFGLREYPEPGYKPRTWANVRDSDATVRIAVDFSSPGERCTLAALKEYERPYFDVYAGRLGRAGIDDWGEFVDFLKTRRVRILNVAGNSEERAFGIGRVAEEFLVKVFRILLAPEIPLDG